MKKYLKVIIKMIFPIIWAYFTWILPYSINPTKYDFNLRFNKVQKLLQRLLISLNVKIDAKDIEEFYKKADKNKNYLLISNHLSNLDPIIYIALAKRPISFVGKKEIAKFPLIGRILKIIDGEFMDRKDLKQSFKIMVNVQNRLKDTSKICDIMIFPEGTRNRNFENEFILPYHHGTFRPAIKAMTNTYCFVTYGTQYIFPTKYKNKYFYVEIKKAIEFNQDDYSKLSTNDLANIAMLKTKEELKEMIPLNKRLMS